MILGIGAAALFAAVLLLPVPVRMKLYFDLDTERCLAAASIFGINIIKARAYLSEDGLHCDLNGKELKYSTVSRGEKRRNGEVLTRLGRGRLMTKRKGLRARLKWGNGSAAFSNGGCGSSDRQRNLKINPLPFLKSLVFRKADILIVEGAATPVRTALNASFLRCAADAFYDSHTVRRGCAAIFEEWNAQRFTALLILTLRHTLIGWIGRLLLLLPNKKTSTN
jgi:hypothetical protein